MDADEYKKLLKKFHKLSDRHIVKFPTKREKTLKYAL